MIWYLGGIIFLGMWPFYCGVLRDCVQGCSRDSKLNLYTYLCVPKCSLLGMARVVVICCVLGRVGYGVKWLRIFLHSCPLVAQGATTSLWR
jgi:hypothetical protein